MKSAFGLVFAIVAMPAAAQNLPDIANGKALIEENCSRCHGIGLTDKSPHPQAPEFRSLSKKYPIASLEEAFGEGIFTGHPDMPAFQMTPEQITGVIAYIESISAD